MIIHYKHPNIIIFNVRKALDKLSKQQIPFTPEETEQILGQTASVLNKLNKKK